MKLIANFYAVLLLVFWAGTSNALPELEEPVELPASFEGIITVYPDNHNTTETRSYWLVPSTARIVRNQNDKLAFGLVHSGVSSFDPDGVNALLNVTAQPYIDEKTLNDAKKLIEQQAMSEGAKNVRFRFVSPTETSAQILIGGQYYDWSGDDKTVVKGGAVEAGIPFQVKIDDNFDVRALVQAGGDDASTFGVLYTMKFNGVGDRCHFAVVADFQETFKHFKASVSASGWFGLVKAAATTEWQELNSKGAVKLEVYSCKKETLDEWDPKELVNGLMELLQQRTGFFAKRLQAGSLPDAPGGAGRWGWGFSAGGGFTGYDDKRELRLEIDAQYTREQEIAFGMSFPSGGPELKRYVKNLTDSKKPYPTSDDYKRIRDQHRDCRNKNLSALKKLKDDGVISDELYDELVQESIKEGCYVDYRTEAVSELLNLPEDYSFVVNNLPDTDLTPEFIYRSLLQLE